LSAAFSPSSCCFSTKNIPRTRARELRGRSNAEEGSQSSSTNHIPKPVENTRQWDTRVRFPKG
jgi:hypothetical protein